MIIIVSTPVVFFATEGELRLIDLESLQAIAFFLNFFRLIYMIHLLIQSNCPSFSFLW